MSALGRHIGPSSIRTGASVLFLAGLAVVMMWPAVSQPDASLAGLDVHIHRSWEAVNRLAFDAGRLPHWNPYSFSGYPGLADIQTQVFYPPSVALRGLPLDAFIAWGVVLHLWVLGTGMFLLCRVLGTSRVAGLAAAAGVMLSGTIAPRILAGHLVMLFGYAWFPLALALTIRSVRRPSIWPHPGLVLVLAVHLLSGSLQGTVYVGVIIAAIFAMHAVRAGGAQRRRLLVHPLLLGVLVGGLTAFQLAPTGLLVLEAGRTGGVDYELASDSPLSPGDLATAVFPNTPGRRRTLFSSLFITLGLLACAPLAWLDARHRRWAAFMTAMALIALGLAMADTLSLYRLHHTLLPPFRGPSRLLFFWTVGVAVLGGLGLDTLLARIRAGGRLARRIAWYPALTAVVLIGVTLAWSSRNGMLGEPGFIGMNSASSPDGVLGTPGWLVAVQIGLVASLGVLARWRLAVASGGVMLLLIVTEGLVFAAPLVGVAGPESETTSVRLASYQPDRVLPLCGWTPSMLAPAGISTTDGYGAISLDRYTRFLQLVRADSAHGHVTRLGRSGTLPTRLDLLDYLSVSHVIACEPIEDQRFRLVDRLGTAFLYKNVTAKPRAFLSCAIESLSSNEVLQRLSSAAYDGAGRLVERVPVNVRWVDGLSAADRAKVERRHALRAGGGFDDDGRTWHYDLGDVSMSNLLSLIRHPLVEDTAGLDRETGQILSGWADAVSRPAPLPGGDTDRSLLLDRSDCTVEGTVDIAAMDSIGDLRLVAEASEPALLFFSEPYFPERRVWVDGAEQPLERVNVAFSGVWVDAGLHVVELRYVPSSFHWGLALSGLTLLCWPVANRLTHARSSGRNRSGAGGSTL